MHVVNDIYVAFGKAHKAVDMNEVETSSVTSYPSCRCDRENEIADQLRWCERNANANLIEVDTSVRL